MVRVSRYRKLPTKTHSFTWPLHYVLVLIKKKVYLFPHYLCVTRFLQILIGDWFKWKCRLHLRGMKWRGIKLLTFKYSVYFLINRHPVDLNVDPGFDSVFNFIIAHWSLLKLKLQMGVVHLKIILSLRKILFVHKKYLLLVYFTSYKFYLCLYINSYIKI